MLPRAWLEEENGTVLGMLNDPTCCPRCLSWPCTRGNLDVQADALGTGVKGPRRDASPAHLAASSAHSHPESRRSGLSAACVHSRHVPSAPRDQARARVASDGSQPGGARELPAGGVRTPTTRSDPTVHWRRCARPATGRAADHCAHGHPPRGQPDARPVDWRQLQLPVVRRAAHAPQRDAIIASQRHA